MPELPEVHTTATMLAKLIVGLRIKAVWTDYGSAYHEGKDNIKDSRFFKAFEKRVVGAKFTRIYRRGKNVLLELDNGETIIVHMKMTGHLLYGTYKRISNYQLSIINKTEKRERKEMWVAAEKGVLQDFRNQFVHFVLTLSNGKHLALSDMRKFAKVTVVPTDSIDSSTHLGDLGPEPLENSFTFKNFKERLILRPRGKIKQVLMDPSVVAGIGNIYSDEMLWLAGIHPLSVVAKVPEKACGKLFLAMKKILSKGIDFGGDSTSDYRNPLGEFGKFQYHHRAYRNTGKSCSKRDCSGTIRRIVIGARSAHFCDRHQNVY